MAELIIEKWHLAVLFVRLDLAGHEPEVATKLVGYPDGTARTMWQQRYPLWKFGLDQTPPKSLTVPRDLVVDVGKVLHGDLNGEAALWLRLEPPYGYLGAVPWESLLVTSTGLPLLRVPDRLPATADLGRSRWRAVIALSAPPRSKWAAPYIRQLTERLQIVPAKADVQVFADAHTAAELSKEPLPPWVYVRDPGEAASAPGLANIESAPSGEPRPGQLWAQWIMSALSGKAVRALHVVLDGGFDLDRPLLALPPDPQRPVPRSQCSWVTADALLALTNAIGADALSLGSPPRNPADAATRMIADSLGQQRAGPTMYSSLASDPDGTALAGAHAFAFDRSGSFDLPRHDSLFAYLQPEHLKGSLRQGWPDQASDPSEQNVLPRRVELPGYQPDSKLEERFRYADDVPSWVAVSDRYLGEQWAGLTNQAASITPTAPMKGAYNKGAEEAVNLLRDIVDRHAR